MIIISTLIGICIIAVATYIAYKIGIRLGRILGIIDREDEHDDLFTKVFQTLLGAPVIMLMCLAIKVAYELGEGAITTLYELIQ